MNKTALAALLAAAPAFALANNFDAAPSCEISTAAFFAPLVQQQLIELRPYKVNSNWISEFRTTINPGKKFFPKGGTAVTAFGMPVDTVFGYASDQVLFAQDPSRQAADVYGVIVVETIANVQAQLRAVNVAKPSTLRVDSRRTMIICKGV